MQKYNYYKFCNGSSVSAEQIPKSAKYVEIVQGGKVRDLIERLQNVEWLGKEKALELFELVDESTMEILIGIETIDEKHGERKEHFKNANEEKLKDIQISESRDYSQ